MPEVSVVTQGQLFGSQSSGSVVPFGKYKNQPLEVLLADPDYVTWLRQAKPDIRSKYPTVFQFIVAHYGEPSRTPDHNALQNRFLDREFQLKFALAACPQIGEWVGLHRVNLNRTFERHFQRSEERLREKVKTSKYAALTLDRELQTLFAEREELRKTLQLCIETGEDRGDFVEYPFAVENLHFEHGGADVVYELRHRWAWRKPGLYDYSHLQNPVLISVADGMYFSIQIKPVLGDDYPAVLRSMKAVHSSHLLVRDYTGTGGTWDMVCRALALDKIKAVRLADVEAISVPAHFDKVRKPIFDSQHLASEM